MNKNKLEDLGFMSDVQAAAERDASRFAYTLSFCVAAFLVVFVMWSRVAILDEVTRGDGQVIPSSRTQIIQNLEGGIVSEIMVNVGQNVKVGDILMRIDNSSAQSNYLEEQTRYNNLRARVIRLEAQVAGRTLRFPKDLKKEAPSAIKQETAEYNLAQQQLNAEVSVLNSRSKQRAQEVEELKSKLKQLENQLSVATRKYNMTQPLVQQGLVPQLDLIRAEGEISDINGEIRTIKLSIPRAQTAVSEAEKQIKEVKVRAKSKASTELNNIRSELESLAQAKRAGEDRIKRTEVTSPVEGNVKDIFINTVGGVLQPGQEIMEIVPTNDTLLVEAKINPSDIAFIRPNQEATIKITAYDFSIYGGLKAQVENISSDTTTDQEGRSFYKVLLRTPETSIKHKGKDLPIIPGMTASVDILTGHKSVFDYLMKPILKAKHEALRER